MRTILLALLFIGAAWAQPEPVRPQMLQSLLGLPEPVAISSPLELPKEIQDKVVWEQTLRPLGESGLESITLMLLRGPALLSEGKLNLMEVDLRRIEDRIPTRLKSEEREEIRKYVEERSPFVRLRDGRRGLIATSKASDDEGGGASLVWPTQDGRYELALYIFGTDPATRGGDADKEFWSRHDWLADLKRVAPKLDALISTEKF